MALRSSKASNRVTGILGETLAEEYLKTKGYKIIEKNARSPLGEIDLIAEDGRTLVFVEVKARHHLFFGAPEEAITQRKKNKLVRLAQWYLIHHPAVKKRVRFDVLAIILSDPPEYRLIQNAFEA